MRLCALSVDLDGVRQYARIHGLPETSETIDPVYSLALERMRRFAAEERLPLTLFAIGEDLFRDLHVKSIRRMVREGHAVENHSLSHRYDLTRLSPEQMRVEVVGGADAIVEAVGVRPTVFRAPGYTVNDALFDVLEHAGVRVDSSVFPCPLYYAAKLAVLAGQTMVGRKSASVVGSPHVMRAPRTPYRPGARWFQQGGRPLLELPIHVTARLRLPAIGTSIGLAGGSGARWLFASSVGDPFINIELHGVDFLDKNDGLAALSKHQPELRMAWKQRLRALRGVVSLLRDAEYTFVRLDIAAKALQALPL